jgi:hypothetical protein
MIKGRMAQIALLRRSKARVVACRPAWRMNGAIKRLHPTFAGLAAGLRAKSGRRRCYLRLAR